MKTQNTYQKFMDLPLKEWMVKTIKYKTYKNKIKLYETHEIKI